MIAVGNLDRRFHSSRHTRSLWLLVAVLLAAILSSLVQAHAAGKTSASEPATQVYFIRGFMGIFSTGFDTMAKSLAKHKVQAKVYGHLSGSAVRARIAKQYAQSKRHKPIILVGHSFGGNAAFEVASGLRKDNIPVELVITVDPTRAGPLSKNVKRYVNYYFSGNGLGSKLKPRSGVSGSRIKNIDMRKRDDVVGEGDDHWTVTNNDAIQSEILRAVRRAAR